ncbi:hypothetical protein NMG60_11014009 [Bertholletia excelsa]
MTVKRSRVSKSPSFADTTTLLPPQRESGSDPGKPPNKEAKAIRRSISQDSPHLRRRILTVPNDPVKVSVDARNGEPVRGFLERCYSCKTKIRENDEVFMYSYFLAFCSAECREKQIAMDKEMGKNPEDLKECSTIA